MKKIKFFNGIGGMCAFAVVALVGSLLFTSCEKEDLNATFTTEPAKATINVNVVEFPSGTALSGVAIAADKGEVSGMTVTLKAGADNSIAAQDVVISATAPAGYEAIQSVTVHVNALKAGGVATYNATLVAVKTATPEDPDQVVITSEVKIVWLLKRWRILPILMLGIIGWRMRMIICWLPRYIINHITNRLLLLKVK